MTSWAWGEQTAWSKLKKPVRASAKKVKYSKSAKGGKRGTAGKWKQSKTNVEIAGTTIPATAVRQIDGVERTVEVRYCLAGTVTYSKPKSLRKGKKKISTHAPRVRRDVLGLKPWNAAMSFLLTRLV